MDPAFHAQVRHVTGALPFIWLAMVSFDTPMHVTRTRVHKNDMIHA